MPRSDANREAAPRRDRELDAEPTSRRDRPGPRHESPRACERADECANARRTARPRGIRRSPRPARPADPSARTHGARRDGPRTHRRTDRRPGAAPAWPTAPPSPPRPGKRRRRSAECPVDDAVAEIAERQRALYGEAPVAPPPVCRRRETATPAAPSDGASSAGRAR